MHRYFGTCRGWFRTLRFGCSDFRTRLPTKTYDSRCGPTSKVNGNGNRYAIVND